MKVIGIGARGISAMKRLQSVHGDAELWAIDSDPRLLSSCRGISQIEVQPSDDSVLSPQDLARLCTPASGPSQEALGSSHNGVAFVLGSSLGSPGGSSLMLQAVSHLRRNGFFVCVALTRPFSFEGPRKLEQADALIEAMEDVASLVVTIDQNVLVRASSELTMPEASRIADNTLEFTVRSMLWALRAPEILKVTHGAFVWHGRDLRLMKRSLFPPMMTLVSCPGVGSLGRGLASIPLTLLREAGLPSTLSTLAEDAVRAAAESPFLEGRVEGRCTAALCVLLLPRSLMGVEELNGLLAASGCTDGGLNDNQREFALRSAVQVAAMTVKEMAGPQCTDIIICPQLRDDEGNTTSDPSFLTIECSLLALEVIEEAASQSPTPSLLKGVAAAAAGGGGVQSSSKSTIRSPLGGSLSLPNQPNNKPDLGPLSRLDLTSSRQQRQSMLIHDSISDLRELEKRGGGGRALPSDTSGPPSSQDETLASSPSPSPSASASASVKKPSKSHWNAMSMIAGGSAQGLSEAQQERLASVRQKRDSTRVLSENKTLPPQASTTSSKAVPMRVGAKPAPAPVPSTQPSWSTDQAPLAQIPRLAERLATSLVAQSLDLPPRAAKWRHQQRVTLASASSQVLKSIPGRIYNLPSLFARDKEMGGVDDEEEMTYEEDKEQERVDVKTRGLKMLQAERD